VFDLERLFLYMTRLPDALALAGIPNISGNFAPREIAYRTGPSGGAVTMGFRLHVWPVMTSLFWASSLLAANDVSSASLEVTADAVQPAGAPVLLMLTVRNTGKLPLRYWWSGPADYPDALDFVAMVAAGGDTKTVPIPLLNGQRPDASGHIREISPGRFLHFPVALRPLPPGKYQINVRGYFGGDAWPAMESGQAITVKIADDGDLLAERDAHVIARVRANDAFAQYVAAKWPRKPVKDALVEDLKGSNVVAADRAAEGLWFGTEPAPEDASIVAEAILHHLHEPDDDCDLGLISKLLGASHKSASGELRSAVDRLANTRSEGRVRDAAVTASNLLSAQPTKTGKRPAQDGGAGNDPGQIARLAALRAMLKSRDPSEREFACCALADFPESEAAVNDLRRAEFDVDFNVRNAARASLLRIDGYRHQNNELPFPTTQP